HRDGQAEVRGRAARRGRPQPAPAAGAGAQERRRQAAVGRVQAVRGPTTQPRPGVPAQEAHRRRRAAPAAGANSRVVRWSWAVDRWLWKKANRAVNDPAPPPDATGHPTLKPGGEGSQPTPNTPQPTIRVLFEDHHLLVVNKPAPLLTQAPPGIPSLEAMAKAYIKAKYAKPAGVYLGIPHRLDRPVSGVVCFARNTKAAQ